MGSISRLGGLGTKILKHSSDTVLSVWKGLAAMATERADRERKKIGTHNGVFHCDEALACFMLQQLPEFSDSEIVRTRDPQILDTCDVVVDVGNEYNHKTHRYDHHQRSFEHTLTTLRPDLAKNRPIKLSSAGLVYAHYGIEVITEMLHSNNILTSTESLRRIYLYVYDLFIEELDAIDNGIPMFSEAKPKYRINSHLSARVSRLNPEWNYPTSESIEDNLFRKAMALVGKEFQERVMEAATVWWPAREIVKRAIETRKKIHPSGEIVLLTERCPWKEHLLTLEEEMGLEGTIKFCVFYDRSDSWRVQGIPLQPDSFICRVFLHRDWRGVRDSELSEVAGIKGCIFCHSTGFIAGNKTKEGAIQMALKSLQSVQVDRE